VSDPELSANFDALFSAATGGQRPFDWQRRLAIATPMPEVVKVATGAGKTEGAVLSWLWRRRHAAKDVRAATPRRLVYCLPMRTLVEQTVARVSRQLARVASDVAVHQLMGGAVARDWIDRPEDDAVLVGTLDQLLSRALMRGYGESRFRWPIDYGLLHSDAHWVYDEVQLFGDALTTSTQLEGLRRTLPRGPGGITSLWMSATVDPAWLESVDHPVPTRVLELGDADHAGALAVRLQAVKTLEAVAQIDAATVVAAHRPATLTLCVVNTVRTARELAKRVRREAGAAEVVLLHSRFRPPDRRRLSDLLGEPPAAAGRIVVATQVVEAGVDISAATLITESAPWASLVQRFGRCNRRGEIDGARVLWARPQRGASPYTDDTLDHAHSLLEALEGASVGPAALDAAGFRLEAPPVGHVLRRRDFLGLFDTAPDLSGSDVDISRFIRDSDEVTCSVAWRDDALTRPPDDTVVAREELCPVALSELAAAQKKRDGVPVWRFDHIDGRWVRIAPGAARPGDRLLVDTSFGCYTADGGFDPALKQFVTPVVDGTALAGDESIGDDPTARHAGVWLSLADHSTGVLAELDSLIEHFPDLDATERWALRTAAALHDWGKAHAVFQDALVDESLPATLTGVPVAKRPGRGTAYARKGFRHELASALAYIAVDHPDPLVTYLIACHHGRVRLGARSLPGEDIAAGEPSILGCREGDTLPAVRLGPGVDRPPVTLSLAPLRLGSSAGATYTDLALDALERFGPVRLGFLEALLRTADRRRSALEQRVTDG